MKQISETQAKYLFTESGNVGNTVTEYDLLIQQVRTAVMTSQEHGILGGMTVKQVVIGLLCSLKIEIIEAVTTGNIVS